LDITKNLQSIMLSMGLPLLPSAKIVFSEKGGNYKGFA
jgi:hypothetical protein